MTNLFNINHEYKICKRCIMDTSSDPFLQLDENGICNYCKQYDKTVISERNNRKFSNIEQLFEKIKSDCKNDEYDCILGISGGVDSSYLAYLAHYYDLRVLAVHVDAGWNSELAEKNIQSICTKLNLDLHTIVVDWSLMKELQRAYMYSGLANQDVPQDQAFLGVHRIAANHHIKYSLSGFNLATEGILSNAYEQPAFDWISIKDVYRRYGRNIGNINKFPHQSLFDKYIRYPLFNKITKLAPLNYIHYTQKDAIELLEKNFDWHYYGGKHYESQFTKFYQESYLPERFGWNKRRDHLSSLIVGGEITRDEALRKIAIDPTPDELKIEERDFVLKRLDISIEDYETMIATPYIDGNEFKSMKKYREHLKKIPIIGSCIINIKNTLDKQINYY